jgi:hypothetical protein
MQKILYQARNGGNQPQSRDFEVYGRFDVAVSRTRGPALRDQGQRFDTEKGGGWSKAAPQT